MFENPRRGRHARNFTTNAPKILDLKSSSEQIFSRKLPLGAPDENGTAFTRRRQLFCLETKIPVSIDQFTSNNCIGTAYQSKVLTNLVCYEGFRQQIRKLFASKVG